MKDTEQDAIRLEAAQQARGESGGKAIEAVKAIEGVHGTIMEWAVHPQSTRLRSISLRETNSSLSSAIPTRSRPMRSGT